MESRSFTFSEPVQSKIDEVRRECTKLLYHAGCPLEEWVNQFDDDADQLCALDVFSRLQLFDLIDVRNACRAMQEFLCESDVDPDRTVYTSFAYGKSGGLTQYFFRNSNHLHHISNIPWCAVGDPTGVTDGPPSRKKRAKPTTLVVVDDYVGTGREMINYFKQREEDLKIYERVFFLCIVAYEDGLRAIAEALPFVTVFCATMHPKLFSSQYRGFSEEDKETRIKPFLVKYGERAYPSSVFGRIATPFGYRDGQSMVVFFYNTPSNTLPIIWSVYNGWIPIFQRYDTYNVDAGAIRRSEHGFGSRMAKETRGTHQDIYWSEGNVRGVVVADGTVKVPT